MSKLKHRACKSFKEFRKIERKYTKKLFGIRHNHNYQNHWYTWIWYDAIGLDALNDIYLNNFANKQASLGHTNLKQILQEARDNFNWSYIDRKNVTWYLRGVEISNEDYYWIYISDNEKKSYSSCVGSFDSVDWKKYTIAIYNKRTQKTEIDISIHMLDQFKEAMVKRGMNIDDYEFKKYE